MLLAFNELAQLEESLPEEYDIKATENIKTALNQLEFLQLHSSFKGVKTSLIKGFIDNQQNVLKSHLTDRSLNLLKTAEQMEKTDR